MSAFGRDDHARAASRARTIRIVASEAAVDNVANHDGSKTTARAPHGSQATLASIGAFRAPVAHFRCACPQVQCRLGPPQASAVSI